MFDRLKIFQVVASAGTFTEAAVRLGRTQSAVSQQIALLEEELGFRVFERRRNRGYLSPEGKELLTAVQDGFDRIESHLTGMKEGLGKVEGRVRLGVLMDYATPFDLSEALVRFSGAHPQVDFEVSFGTNQEIERRLNEGSIDLGISIVFDDKVPLRRHSILTTPHVLVASRRLHGKIKGLSLKEVLAQCRVIDFSGDFLCLEPWARKNGPELVSVLRKRAPSAIVPNHLESLKMVLKDWGVAVLPQYLCAPSLKDGTLVKVKPGSKDLVVGLDIAYLRRRTLRKCESLFVESILAPSP